MLWRSPLRGDSTAMLGPGSRRRTHCAYFVSSATGPRVRAVSPDTEQALRPVSCLANALAPAGARAPQGTLAQRGQAVKRRRLPARAFARAKRRARTPADVHERPQWETKRTPRIRLYRFTGGAPWGGGAEGVSGGAFQFSPLPGSCACVPPRRPGHARGPARRPHGYSSRWRLGRVRAPRGSSAHRRA